MKAMNDVGLLFKRGFTQTLRDPVWVVVGLSSPILYLLLFTPLLQKFAGFPGFPANGVLNLFLPGILAFVAFGTGTGEGYGVIFQLSDGLVERMRVTPASRSALLIGPIFSDIAWLFIFDTALVAVAIPFGYVLHPVGVLVMFVMLALLLAATACFSVSMALINKEISRFAALMNGIYLPILLLAGVLLPISLGPVWMHDLAYIDPLFYVVEANRILASGVIIDRTVGLGFLVMAGLTIFMVWWATRVYRKAVA